MLAPTDTATVTGVDADRVAALRAHPVCRRIKAAVLAVEPEAEVMLFGSRARGDAREDSDWDVLVLVAGELHEDGADASATAFTTRSRRGDSPIS